MTMATKRATTHKTGKTASRSDLKLVRDLQALYLRGMPLTPKAIGYLTEVIWMMTQAASLDTGRPVEEVMLGSSPSAFVHAAIEMGLRTLLKNLKAIGVENLISNKKGQSGNRPATPRKPQHHYPKGSRR